MQPSAVSANVMLEAGLSARVDGGSVDLVLTVTNRAEESVTLRFRNGQRAEFTAYDPDDRPEGSDEPRWRFGDGRLFTQAMAEERIEPETSTTYEATWSDAPSGAYRLVGEVVGEIIDGETVAGSPLSAETTVRVRR